MTNNFYTVYQVGCAIYGVGRSPSEAVENAREWVDDPESLDNDLVPRHRANTGDMVLAPCSEQLFDEVSSVGGDISFDERGDIIRLYTEGGE